MRLQLFLGCFCLMLGTLAARADTAPCLTAGFACHTVAIGESWDTLWPDATQRDLAQRLNRMNIRLTPGMIIASPANGTWPDLLALSPLARTIPTTGREHLVVDLAQLAWGAYNADGALVRWGPLAAGKDWCADVQRACRTPAGEFTMQRKGSRSCASHTYPAGKGGAAMPYCMFFYRGYALHGGSLPGRHASHGCARLLAEDARWLNQEFITLPTPDGTTGTPLTILPYH